MIRSVARVVSDLYLALGEMCISVLSLTLSDRGGMFLLTLLHPMIISVIFIHKFGGEMSFMDDLCHIRVKLRVWTMERCCSTSRCHHLWPQVLKRVDLVHV